MAEQERLLMERYELKAEDCSKQVSDRHLEELSRTHCSMWRRLPAHLNMDTIVEEDIDRKASTEDEKRLKFFKEWKGKKGSDATYKTLIVALLKVDRRQDAEYLCELLQSELRIASNLPSAAALEDVATIELTETTALSSTPEASGDLESAKRDLAQNLEEKKVSMNDLDPDTREELIIQLETKRDEIKKKYAAFVESLYKAIEAKNLTLKVFQLYLLSIPAYESRHDGEQPVLLDDVKAQIKAAESIIDIFQILVTDCCSFMNIGIFECIIERYNINTNSQDLQYSQHLKQYFKGHRISEFMVINPKLKEVEDKEKMILKFDVTLPNYITKVFNLKRAIAKILRVKPCALCLLSIEEGCVIVTFSLPTAVAECLFASGLTPTQEADIRAQSVLWLKCGSYTLQEVSPSSEITPTVPPIVLSSHTTPSIALESSTTQMHTGKLPAQNEPEVKEMPASRPCKEEINIAIIGERRTGKTELLRNLFGTDVQSTSHIQRLEKNEVILNILDVQSLIKNPNLEPEKTLTCDLLIYCINVVYPKRLQVKSRDIEWLQEVYGQNIWECCVIVFTFSNILLQEITEKTPDKDDDIKTKYTSELEEYLGEFRRILRKLKVSCTVKTVFEADCFEYIIGIPSGLKDDDPVLLEEDGWTDHVFVQMLIKCKKRKELTQFCYGKDIAIASTEMLEDMLKAVASNKETGTEFTGRAKVWSGAGIGPAGRAVGGSRGSTAVAAQATTLRGASIAAAVGAGTSLGMAVGGPLGMVIGGTIGAVVATWLNS